jgi:hypothetical protein
VGWEPEIWLLRFASRIAPDFVPPGFDVSGIGSERFSWLYLDELEAALDLCNSSCPGFDGLRFSLFQELPPEAKLCLLDIYNDILRTGVVLESWYRTKVVPIMKPGKNPALSDSYRPISLLACGRKDDLYCTHLDFWAAKNEILSSTQYGLRKGRRTWDCSALLRPKRGVCYPPNWSGFGFKLSSPAGVFSAELSALFMALQHIREVIQPPRKCLILSDSLSSIKAMLSRRI